MAHKIVSPKDSVDEDFDMTDFPKLVIGVITKNLKPSYLCGDAGDLIMVGYDTKNINLTKRLHGDVSRDKFRIRHLRPGEKHIIEGV